MHLRIFRLAFFSCILLLAGCIDDSASFAIGAHDHALSLIREQRYFWEDEVELSLVVTRLPDCQQRHSLESVAAAGLKIQLYETDSQTYLLRQNKNWYAADSDTCSMSVVEPPKEAAQGTLLGAFEQDDDEKFTFVKAELTKQP